MRIIFVDFTWPLRRREFELDLLSVPERGDVRGRRDKGVVLPVRDVSPPELLLVVREVGRVDGMGDLALALQRFLAPVHLLLDLVPLGFFLLVVDVRSGAAAVGVGGGAGVTAILAVGATAALRAAVLATAFVAVVLF